MLKTENNIVYAVISYGGEWEDKWEELETVCSSLENAEKYVKDYCSAFDDSNLPMTMEQYQNANYGYSDEEDSEELVDRDGFTVADFLKMEDYQRLKFLDFTGIMIVVCVLDGPTKEVLWYDQKGERRYIKNV